MRKTVNHSPAASATFKLNNLQIGLLSNSQHLIDQANNEFLEDWILAQKAPFQDQDDVQIYLELVDQLPPPPNQPPIYQGDKRSLKDGIGTLSVYQESDGFLLDFHKSGRIHLKPKANRIEGLAAIELLHYHRLYDLLFTSLSSFLRGHGCYLIHGSAAVHNQSAAIFVGPPGTAKSTTVLNLALNGWTILSDDTLLLEERPDGIYALPTPGGFSIRSQSVKHIPALAAYLPRSLHGDSFELSPPKLNLTWAEPAPISTIYFPTIEEEGQNQYQPLPKALAFAHLLELSLDRWDVLSFPAHFSFLEKLSRQANAVSLTITNQKQIPDLLLHHQSS